MTPENPIAFWPEESIELPCPRCGGLNPIPDLSWASTPCPVCRCELLIDPD
jgi:hypothetical protein